MMNRKDPNAIEGMRVRAGKMPDDPNPIPSGTMGTIYVIDDSGTIHVNWEIPIKDEEGKIISYRSRKLGLIPGIDEYELEPGVQDFFDTVNEGLESNPRIKNSKTTKAFKSSKLIEKKGEKKSKKNKKEDDIDEMTGAGGAGAPTSSGPYVGPTRVLNKKKKKDLLEQTTTTSIATTMDFLVSNLVGWGVKGDMSPPWPSPKKKAENNEIEHWWWQKNPTYNGGGVITDPYAKTDDVWNDDILDANVDNNMTQFQKEVYKNPNKYKKSVITIDKGFELNIDPNFRQPTDYNGVKLKPEKSNVSLKKEDLLLMVKNRLNEVEKKEDLEETTTFGSVFGARFPVGPAFAAKQGKWRAGKNPIYQGGKIVQRIENSGVLNPINEANPVKYHPKAQYVKIKKKCTKYPYCSQGAVDKPLNISNKMTEPGTYVEEQLMRNIHEVAKMTGKSFQEVYNIVKNQIFIK